MHEKRPWADRDSCTIRTALDALQKNLLKRVVTMPLIRRLGFAVLIASLGFTATTGRVAAEEAKGSGQPSNQIGLVKDHKPVNYVANLLYFVDGSFIGQDRFTQTWSMIERKEGKSEHALKLETQTIDSYSPTEEGKTFLWRNKIKEALENSTLSELCHQEEDRGLVVDAVETKNGKIRTFDGERKRYIFPGTMKIGTTWTSEPVASATPGVMNHEVIGYEVYNGTNCWVIRSDRETVRDPLIPNSETVKKTSRFLFDPLTLSVLRIDSVTEGIGPAGRKFRFVLHLEAIK
jgi:hypothetical protein